MKTADLDYTYPDELIATEPKTPPRVMLVETSTPTEISFQDLLARIPAGDLLVVNDTKVLKRRVFAGDLEILFLGAMKEKPRHWEVLFPSRTKKIGDEMELPFGAIMKLVAKGRPQVVEISRDLNEGDFERAAELPLPPYIQKARGERHNRQPDESWYQTAWAQNPGSFAAPTASLHFKPEDIEGLKARGVQVEKVTLHVGLGTFLPVTAEDLDHHTMHAEIAEIPAKTARALQRTKASGAKIWALGTTVTRTLESAAVGKLEGDFETGFRGATDLLIQPGYEWQMVDRLLTNFHQPKSTLLALVSAFAGAQTVKACYAWAIERRYRLFSYGDFSLWIR